MKKGSKEKSPDRNENYNSHSSKRDETNVDYKLKRILSNSKNISEIKLTSVQKCKNHIENHACYILVIDKSPLCLQCAFIYEMINFEDNTCNLNMEEIQKREIVNKLYSELLLIHKDLQSISNQRNYFEVKREKSLEYIQKTESKINLITKQFFEKIKTRIRSNSPTNSSNFVENNFEYYEKILISIISDIESNYDKIILQIEYTPFKEIISSYYDKFYRVQEIINDLKSKDQANKLIKHTMKSLKGQILNCYNRAYEEYI